MKKVAGIVVLGITVLGGCTIETTTAPAATDASRATERVVETTLSVRERFLNAVEDEIGGPVYADDMAVETGYKVCDAMDAGSSLYDVAGAIAAAAEDGETQDLLVAVTRQALLVLCPEWAYKIDA